MDITFQFEPEKAIQAMAYILHQLASVEKVKLTKLLYIADREHFLEEGYPITGDRQFAMKWGPVPSGCLELLDDEADTNGLFEYFQIVNNTLFLRHLTAFDKLGESERRVLDHVIAEHGSKYRWDLVEETHHFPEYRDVYVKGTSTFIPYELMLKHYGNENQFMFGRPVISEKMSKHMLCPFPTREPDL